MRGRGLEPRRPFPLGACVATHPALRGAASGRLPPLRPGLPARKCPVHRAGVGPEAGAPSGGRCGSGYCVLERRRVIPTDPDLGQVIQPLRRLLVLNVVETVTCLACLLCARPTLKQSLVRPCSSTPRGLRPRELQGYPAAHSASGGCLRAPWGVPHPCFPPPQGPAPSSQG